MRPHAASRHGHDHSYDQEQQHQPTHGCQLLQTTARISHAAAQPVQFARAYPAQGLRDFSPGAKAISAIRPPLSATQEFLVTGYLSV